jgi:hypothetical protein
MDQERDVTRVTQAPTSSDGGEFQTTNEDDLITDLAQTFTNLRVYRWKLNSENCVLASHLASF